MEYNSLLLDINLNRNKYPVGTMMHPRPVVELMDKQIFWECLKHFHCDFLSGFTIIYGEKYAFLSLFTKVLRMDGWTEGQTQPLIEMRGRI